jgi:hypothetical protein
VTLDQVRASYLVTGEGVDSKTWDRAWRALLVDNLAVLVGQFWQVGIDRIFVDGSFVEAKDHPNDIDGYFECDLRYVASGQLERDLNRLDPYKVWTWSPSSRRPDPNSAKSQLPMWHRYRVELYPHFGQPAGIRDQNGNVLMFPAAFRRRRGDGQAKGILRIVR